MALSASAIYIDSPLDSGFEPRTWVESEFFSFYCSLIALIGATGRNKAAFGGICRPARVQTLAVSNLD